MKVSFDIKAKKDQSKLKKIIEKHGRKEKNS